MARPKLDPNRQKVTLFSAAEAAKVAAENASKATNRVQKRAERLADFEDRLTHAIAAAAAKGRTKLRTVIPAQIFKQMEALGAKLAEQGFSASVEERTIGETGKKGQALIVTW